MSLADYKNKIFLILQEMNRLHTEVLRENRYYVDIYLGHHALAGVEHILRSCKTSEEYSSIRPELVTLTEAYTNGEEERLKKNLENIGYDMDSATTVTFITGPGRIERVRDHYHFIHFSVRADVLLQYLFPLLYVTLRRHLEVFHYACRHIVDSEEFPHMCMTLGSIFDVVEQRIENLGGMPVQLDIVPATYQHSQLSINRFTLT